MSPLTAHRQSGGLIPREQSDRPKPRPRWAALCWLPFIAVSVSCLGCSDKSTPSGSSDVSKPVLQSNRGAEAQSSHDTQAAARRRTAKRQDQAMAAAPLQAVGKVMPADPLSPAKNAATPAENAATVVPSPVGPESWATFRNGNNQLGIAKTTLADRPEVLWQFTTSDGVVACAAIVGDQVYVPCLNGDLISLDRKSGKKQWTYHSLERKNPNDFAPGFKAAPSVSNDVVYLGDEDGMMHAVDRRTGKARWKFRTGAEIAGSAALLGNNVIFGSHDSFLYCLKAADASLVWKPFQTENFINCSTAIEADNTFIAGCDTKVRVINIVSGKEVSEVPLGEGAYLIASPAVLGDLLYVGTHDGRVVAVDWRKQRVAWTFTDPEHPLEYRSSAAVTDKYVILGGYDKELHCLNRATGNQVWSFKTRARIESSPVVVGERIFFGSGDGNLYAVGLDSGKEVWKYRCGHSITASPAVGEHCLVIGSDTTGGTVYCFGSKGS